MKIAPHAHAASAVLDGALDLVPVGVPDRLCKIVKFLALSFYLAMSFAKASCRDDTINLARADIPEQIAPRSRQVEAINRSLDTGGRLETSRDDSVMLCGTLALFVRERQSVSHRE